MRSVHNSLTWRRWPARAVRRAELWWRGLTGYREDEGRLGHESREFWNEVGQGHPQRAQEAHWRGHGPFADDAVWLKLGRDHLQILQRTLQARGLALAPQRVLEWGCGGGMNAVHLAAGTQAYFGVDIAAATLQECRRQVEAAGHRSFVPVLVDPNSPRDALREIGAPCDLFVCTYVFELLPSEAHALAVLDIARDALRPGGVALVHVRLARGGPGGGSRPWGYARNMAHNVRFQAEAFAQACQARGLQVLERVRVSEVPELGERDYAYFVLQR
jgi:SAM-dependent methyltransferase